PGPSRSYSSVGPSHLILHVERSSHLPTALTIYIPSDLDACWRTRASRSITWVGQHSRLPCDTSTGARSIYQSNRGLSDKLPRKTKKISYEFKVLLAEGTDYASRTNDPLSSRKLGNGAPSIKVSR
ncbi:hypothetical protein BHM03_00021193, partial [Ensete ventricosum]